MQDIVPPTAAAFLRRAVGLAIVATLGAAGTANAFSFDTDSDWKVRFDNTILYTLGLRAQGIDSRLGNSPVLTESDYRFPGRGDVVTNRLSWLSEVDAVYQRRLGMRLSATIWNDAAYDGRTRSTPWTSLGLPSNYTNRQYSSYTKDNHVRNAEILDAFVFANFDLNDRPASVKLGRFAQYWGNSLFFNAAGVSFAQSATDVVKQMTAPGTQAKELTRPRGQLNFNAQVSDKWQVGAQYFLEWEADRMPAGGTYLGMADFLFEGPDQWAATAFDPANRSGQPFPRSWSSKPKDINGNFGLQAQWSPDWLEGTMGFYLRQFDETVAWDPMLAGRFIATPGGPVPIPTNYRLAYPKKTKLLGWSLNKQIGGISVGLDASYRKDTGFNTVTTFDPLNNLDGSVGPRGDTLNVVVNAMSLLERSSWYDTGVLLSEIAVVHKMKVSEQAQFYKAEGTAACDANVASSTGGQLRSGNKSTGCSTDTAVMIAGMFEPQWLQARPGWDLSLPVFGMYGLHGTAASNGFPVQYGDLMYSVGVKGVYAMRHNFTLQYNGYKGKNPGVIMGPLGAEYSGAGNRMYRYNDRDWVSFTFSTTF